VVGKKGAGSEKREQMDTCGKERGRWSVGSLVRCPLIMDFMWEDEGSAFYF